MLIHVYWPYGVCLPGVLKVIEGEMENQNDLIVLLNDYGRLGWQLDAVNLDAPVFTTTKTVNITAENKGPIDFQTEFDWQTRHWQYISNISDRGFDFVNFRDKQTSVECPRLHNYSVAVYRRCVANDTVDFDPQYLASTPIINWLGSTVSLGHFQSSKVYEDCLAEHVVALQAYQTCVRNQLRDYDSFSDWYVGDRECVGGGGECGPPADRERPFPNAVTLP